MQMFNPAHPGEILKELVIESLGITITDAAEHLGVSRKTLSKILNGKWHYQSGNGSQTGTGVF